MNPNNRSSNMSSDIQRSASPHRTHSVPFPIGTTYIELTNAINIETTSNPKAIQVRHPKEAIANTVTDLGLDYLPYIVRTNKPGTTLDTTITGQQDQSDPNTSPDPNSQPYPIKVELMSKQESLYAWVANIKDKIEEYNNNLPDIVNNTIRDPVLDIPARVTAIELAFSHMPEEKKTTFIKDILNDKYPKLTSMCKISAIHQIKHLPEDQRATFIEDILYDVYSTQDTIMDLNNKITAINQIQHLPEDQRLVFINNILNENIPNVTSKIKTAAVDQIRYLPENERTILLEDILLNNKYPELEVYSIYHAIEQLHLVSTSNNSLYNIIKVILEGKHPNINIEAKKNAANKIHCISNSQKIELIEDVLSNKYLDLSPNTISNIVGKIGWLEPKDIHAFIKDTLSGVKYPDLNDYIKGVIVSQIKCLPEDQRAALLEDALLNVSSLDVSSKRASILQIEYLPEDQRARFIEDLLNNKYSILDQSSKELVIDQIQYLNQDEMAIFIKSILSNKYPPLYSDCKKIAMSKIKFLSQEDSYIIIDNILLNKYPDLNLPIDDIFGKYIWAISQDQKTIIIEDILKGEKYPNLGLHHKQVATKQIQYLSKDEGVKVIKNILKGEYPSSNSFIKQLAVDQISYLPRAKRIELYKLALSLNLIYKEEYINMVKQVNDNPIPTTSPLHEIAQQDRIVKLDKTGSETFILPIPNVEEIEASVRIINYPSFLAWLKAATAIDTWKELGFDYIPIEPILDFNSSNNIKVAITTTNLRGASLEESSYLYDSNIKDQIEATRDLIKDTLVNKLSIEHGHTHNRNFVLVPQLDSNNQPDPSKMPRIYVIDFDIAKSI